MTDLMHTAAEALQRNGFEVHTVFTAAEAHSLILSLIPPQATVGIGGSMTIRELGVADALQAAGHSVAWHWLPCEDRHATLRSASQADFYLTSSNAVTRDGQLVNIDGNGNRIAAMIHGPGSVIAAVGVNKLVDGGVNSAIARIKQYACPPNARRLGIDTPCARTGRCDPDACGDATLCSVTAAIRRPAKGRRFIVILIDQALGY